MLHPLQLLLEGLTFVIVLNPCSWPPWDGVTYNYCTSDIHLVNHTPQLCLFYRCFTFQLRTMSTDSPASGIDTASDQLREAKSLHFRCRHQYVHSKQDATELTTYNALKLDFCPTVEVAEVLLNAYTSHSDLLQDLMEVGYQRSRHGCNNEDYGSTPDGL